jgi:hypothetical protein
MKKVTLYLIAMMLLISLVACKSSEQKASEEAAKQPQTQQGGASTGAQEQGGAVDANKAEPDVDNIEIGKAVDANKKVSDETDDFVPSDTVYASIKTDGAAANSKVVARWTFGDSGQLVKEDTHTVPAGGVAWTEFHIKKPGGFPKGQYTVSFMINGDDKGKKTFQVK